MSLPRYAAKRDAIEGAIVQALEAIGVTVTRVSGPGLPDLICTRDGGVWWAVEVKSGTRGKLTPKQQKLHARMPIVVVRSVAEALALFGVKA